MLWPLLILCHHYQGLNRFRWNTLVSSLLWTLTVRTPTPTHSSPRCFLELLQSFREYWMWRL